MLKCLYWKNKTNMSNFRVVHHLPICTMFCDERQTLNAVRRYETNLDDVKQMSHSASDVYNKCINTEKVLAFMCRWCCVCLWGYLKSLHTFSIRCGLHLIFDDIINHKGFNKLLWIYVNRLCLYRYLLKYMIDDH